MHIFLLSNITISSLYYFLKTLMLCLVHEKFEKKTKEKKI